MADWRGVVDRSGGKAGSGYLLAVELPSGAAERLDDLRALLAALLDPDRGAELPARDPEGLHALSRAVRQDVPEAVDAYVRTRRWSRPAPGQEAPENHLERQLSALHKELTGWRRTCARARPAARSRTPAIWRSVAAAPCEGQGQLMRASPESVVQVSEPGPPLAVSLPETPSTASSRSLP
ncbi:hypothetical protein RKD23_002805 [Streptomyces sp. SAI-170]